MRRLRACWITHSTHSGGAGAPPGGHYGLPARSLADGWPARCAGQRKARPAPEGRRCDGAPRGARALEREYGTERTMVAPLGAPSPSSWRGRGEGTTAYPAPQRIRALTRAPMTTRGCLTIESVRRARAVISNVLAAVDVDLGAVHVGAGLGAQHVDDLRDFVGRAEAVHRDLLRRSSRCRATGSRCRSRPARWR